MSPFITRSLAAALCAALVLVSPGSSAYAAAGRLSSKADAAPSSSSAARAAAPAMRGLQGVPALTPGAAAPGAIKTAGVSAAAGAAVEAAAARGAEAKAEALSRGVAETMAAAGPLERASDGQAREAGVEVERALTAESFSNRSSDGFVYAKPAGRDSIGAPAAALFKASRAGDSGTTPPAGPPAPPAGPNPGGDGDGQGPRSGLEKAPIVPRVLTSLATLAPAYFLGWPLLAPALTLASVAGGLIIATSILFALAPFMSARWPSAVRAAPGFLLIGLGAVSMIIGFPTLAAHPLAMGAMVALGGYGFARFALGRSEERGDTALLVGTYIGGLAAVTGAGLALLAPAGALAGLGLAAGYALTLVLFMHLPSWVGAGVKAAFRGGWQAGEDAVEVATSLHRDTSMGRRLERYSEAAIKRSAWNVIWVGLVIWAPVLVVETAKALVGFAVGVIKALARAPLFALWGISAKLWPESGLTRFFAGWSRAAAAVTKVSRFNPLESRFIAAANSSGWITRHAGAAMIVLAQAWWMVESLVWIPLSYAFGWIAGLRELGKPYDAERHDPRRQARQSDPLPAQVPSLPPAEVKAAWPGKTIALIAAAAPAVWLAGALWTSGPLGWLALAAVAAVALMPIMPASGWQGETRKLPGTLLSAVGAFLTYGAVVSLLGGLPGMGLMIAVGVVAVFAGLGLRGMIDAVADPKAKTYEVDGAPYILGFVAAVAMGAALAVFAAGLTGAVVTGFAAAALLLSPALLYHLPRSLWSGVWRAVRESSTSVEQVYAVMKFYRSGEGRFARNMGDWFSHYTRKSVFYAPMFMVHGILMLAAYLGEAVVGLAGGLVVSVFRAPTRFAAGASHRRWQDAQSKLGGDERSSPASAWWPRFWRELDAWLVAQAEGSKERVFDKQVKSLMPLINQKRVETSSPTLSAYLALGVGRLAQVYWLARTAWMLILTPVLLIPAAFAAKRKADSMGPVEPGEFR